MLAWDLNLAIIRPQVMWSIVAAYSSATWQIWIGRSSHRGQPNTTDMGVGGVGGRFILLIPVSSRNRINSFQALIIIIMHFVIRKQLVVENIVCTFFLMHKHLPCSYPHNVLSPPPCTTDRISTCPDSFTVTISLAMFTHV